VATISREHLDVKALGKCQVCSRHFVTSKPAALKDDANVDWLPTIDLGHSKGVWQASAEQAVAKVMHYERARRRDMKQAREQKEIEALHQMEIVVAKEIEDVVKEESASVVSAVINEFIEVEDATNNVVHQLLRKQLCQSPGKLDINRWN